MVINGTKGKITRKAELDVKGASSYMVEATASAAGLQAVARAWEKWRKGEECEVMLVKDHQAAVLVMAVGEVTMKTGNVMDRMIMVIQEVPVLPHVFCNFGSENAKYPPFLGGWVGG